MIFILGHSYPPFVMKNQKLREKLMLREFERLVDQPKGLLWKIWNLLNSWSRKNNNKRISKEPQSSNNSWLVNSKNRHRHRQRFRPWPAPILVSKLSYMVFYVKLMHEIFREIDFTKKKYYYFRKWDSPHSLELENIL